jgi:sugar phosphate isomerase/epimerase
MDGRTGAGLIARPSPETEGKTGVKGGNVDPRLSVSAAAFDGYELPVVFGEISALGARYVELAFIQGYMDAFGEEAFSEKRAKTVRRDLAEAGLSCFAFSAHMDLSGAEAVGIFERRMAFAKSVGAEIIVTNAAPRFREKEFFQNIEALARKAEYLELTIGLENPGDGRENVVNCGRTGAKTIERGGSPFVRLNYDFGNTVSHFFEKRRPEEDFLPGLPYTGHLHLKDVKAFEEGWYFTEIGKGSVDYAVILRKLAEEKRTLPMSLEIPLRFARAKDASPRRAPRPVPLERIRDILRGSLRYVKGLLKETAGATR